MHIVSGQLHIAVEKVESTVKASHPGCGDTVATAPAAHSTTHSAATATHALHHAAGHIIETAVVCIVSIKDYADLAFISKSSDHCGALITSVIHVGSGSRNIVTAATHDISEPAFHHSRLKGQVNDSLLITIVDTGKEGLIRLFLHHLHLFDKFGRNILGSQLRVIKEERLSVNHNLRDGLAISRNRTIGLNFHARQFLKKFLKHIIIRGLEG